MTDGDRVDAIADLCRNFSPSIIPELREHARKQREVLRSKYPATEPWPIYPYDHACDFIEAVMVIALEHARHLGMCGVMAQPEGWAVYDELRNYGRRKK